MRYNHSSQFRNAKGYHQFIGLKSKEYEGRSFVIDEHDAKMIVANLRKSEYGAFKREFKKKNYSSFSLLQDFEYKRNK